MEIKNITKISLFPRIMEFDRAPLFTQSPLSYNAPYSPPASRPQGAMACQIVLGTLSGKKDVISSVDWGAEEGRLKLAMAKALMSYPEILEKSPESIFINSISVTRVAMPGEEGFIVNAFSVGKHKIDIEGIFYIKKGGRRYFLKKQEQI